MVILDKWLIIKDGCVMNTDTGEIHWFSRNRKGKKYFLLRDDKGKTHFWLQRNLLELYKNNQKENPKRNG
jgi:Ni,Fe-hydrogenase maturation factor